MSGVFRHGSPVYVGQAEQITATASTVVSVLFDIQSLSAPRRVSCLVALCLSPAIIKSFACRTRTASITVH
jgi:hypothetical protein